MPLWLPEGSVRAIMALGIVASYIAHILLTAEGTFEFNEFIFTVHTGMAAWIGKSYFEARDGAE